MRSFPQTHCFICNGDHITALCPDHDFSGPRPIGHGRDNNQSGQQNPPNSGQVQYINIPLTVDDIPNKPKVQEIGDGIYRLPENDTYTMMQIAKVTVQSADTPQNDQTVYGVIDSCSQRSTITCNLARKLNIDLCESETTNILTLNGPKDMKTHEVAFNVLCKGGDDGLQNLLQINGQAVEKIYPEFSVPGFPLSESDEQLFRIAAETGRLADPDCNKPRKINLDLIIGSDYFPYVASMDKVHLKRSNVMLLGTPLGYVTAGRAKEIILKEVPERPSSQLHAQNNEITTLTCEKSITAVSNNEQSIAQTPKECSLEHLKLIFDAPIMHKMKVTTLPSPKMPILISGIKPQIIQTQSIQRQAQIPKLTSCTTQVLVTGTVLQPSTVQVVQNLDAMKSHSCTNEYLQQDVQQPLQNIPMQKIPKNH